MALDISKVKNMKTVIVQWNKSGANTPFSWQTPINLPFKCTMACIKFISVAASTNNFIDINSDLDISCTKLVSYVNSVRNAVEINHYFKPNASVTAGSANFYITTNSATDQEIKFNTVPTTFTISMMIEFYEL